MAPMRRKIEGEEAHFVELLLQYMEEKNWTKSSTMLEQETGVHFSLKNFESMVMAGHWEDLEDYLYSFTDPTVTESNVMFFKIRKEKFLEMLDRKEKKKALDILLDELKGYPFMKVAPYNELCLLLGRDHDEKLGNRKKLWEELERLIKSHSVLKEKLPNPIFTRGLINELVDQFRKCCFDNNSTKIPTPTIHET